MRRAKSLEMEEQSLVVGQDRIQGFVRWPQPQRALLADKARSLGLTE
jgi:hypothetical protein